jgi:hypothetical protein
VETTLDDVLDGIHIAVVSVRQQPVDILVILTVPVHIGINCAPTLCFLLVVRFIQDAGVQPTDNSGVPVHV